MAEVSWNLGAVLRDLEQLERGVKPALAKSLNRAATAVRTAAQRSVRSELNIKAKDVNKLIRLERARVRDLQAVIHVTPKPAPLIAFGARQTRAGVSVKVKRKGSRQVVRHAFIATMRSGHKGVFTRYRKAGLSNSVRNLFSDLKGRSGRLPIRELFSTAVVQYLDDARVVSQLGAVARSTFEKAIAHEIQFRLAKQAAGPSTPS